MKSEKRTTIYMECLHELITFVTAKIEADQVYDIMLEVQQAPKYPNQTPRTQSRIIKSKRWEDWWNEKLNDKPEYSNEQKMLFNIIGQAIFFEKGMKKCLDFAFD